MLAPTVSVAPPKPTWMRSPDPVPPMTTSPVPPNVCVPGLNRRTVVEPPLASVNTALSVSPFTMLVKLEIVELTLMTTPLSVPPLPLVVIP